MINIIEDRKNMVKALPYVAFHLKNYLMDVHYHYENKAMGYQVVDAKPCDNAEHCGLGPFPSPKWKFTREDRIKAFKFLKVSEGMTK